jgi:aerobic carbon-monoxide dehydrogenase small subunit
VKISFTLNNWPVSIDVPDDMRVIDLIREPLHLTGSKEGCGSGECGACTIVVDDEIRLACLMLAAQLEGRRVTTIEGITAMERFKPLQQAFIDHGAVQCGFCTPGMFLAAAQLLSRNPHPTRKEIREGISGNLCRCTGYQKIVDAVRAAADETEEAKKG